MKLAAVIMLIAGAAPVASVQVAVSNVRNANGHVLVAVCLRTEFLSPRCQFAGSAPAQPGTVTVHIAGIPPGTYAVQAFQDENDNMKIDRTFFGLPTEGIGFSNNAAFNFGPPSFQDAAISLGAEDIQLTVRLRYFTD